MGRRGVGQERRKEGRLGESIEKGRGDKTWKGKWEVMTGTVGEREREAGRE